jgi:hypothetical protein
MRTAILSVLLASGAFAQQFVPYNTGLPGGPPGTASDAGWSGLSIADVDGNGVPDVTAIGRKGTGSRVFRYQGAGAFLESSAGLARPLSGRAEVAVADFNGDGLMDVVDSDWGGYFQLATGQFVPMPNVGFWPGEGTDAGDVDGDGIPDVVVTGHLQGTLRCLRGDGAGNWIDSSSGLPTAPAVSGIGGGRKCKLVDLDLDGDLDLAAVLYYASGVWLNDGNGNWTSASSGINSGTVFPYLYGVDSADFNLDGWPDLVFSDFTGSNTSAPVTCAVFLGNGGASWTLVNATGIPSGLSACDVAAGDVTGDGIADIAVGIRVNLGPPTGIISQVVVLVGFGNGAFWVHGDTGLAPHPDVAVNIFNVVTGRIEALDIADLNLDGLGDLSYVAYGFGVYAYVQNGALPLGSGWPGDQGFVPVAAAFGGQPHVGNPGFGLSLTAALGGAPALLAVADAPGPVGLPGVPGAILWLDPFLATQLVLFPGSTSGAGAGQGSWTIPAPIALDPGLLGIVVWAQFGVADPGAVGGLALSNGLRLSVSY